MPQLLFTPGKDLVPIVRRLGGPQSRSRQVRKISPPPGFDPGTVQPVAIPGPLLTYDSTKIL